MAARDDIRDFLTTRRAKITPEQSGLPVYGGNRRVTGLRREEVALLAGISVEYYTRLERGRVGSVSDSVLDGLVHALQLDEAERDHLYRLVRTAGTPASARAPRRTPAKKRVRPTIQRLLDQMPMPAYLRNGRFDILAANDLGRALYSPLYEQADRGAHPNSARFLFLDRAAPEFFVDYDRVLNDCVAFLRAEAGRDPYDKDLSELIGELSTRSEDFRRRWAAHDVRYHRTGRKRFHHPLVGDLELDYEALELPGDPGQRINVYTAPPDSPSTQALNLLASWSIGESAPARTNTMDGASTDV
jgi:transcriptional regulator with XRE-family HTH domain